MVNAVSAVSQAQNASLKPGVQSAAPATPAPPPPLSSIDFVTSEIYVNNLQNVAILEYRSSQTGQVLQQYPNQAQINAFKAAQRLSQDASQQQAQAVAAHHAAAAAASDGAHETDTTAHVATPAMGGADTSGGSADDSSGTAGSSGGKTTTSVVA